MTARRIVRQERLTRYCADVGETGRGSNGEGEICEVREENQDNGVRREQQCPFAAKTLVTSREPTLSYLPVWVPVNPKIDDHSIG